MNIEPGSWAEWAAAGVAAIGFLFALRELHRSTQVQRAQALLDATQRYFGDVEVRRLYYDLDYNQITLVFENDHPKKWIRADSSHVPFIGSNEERCLDSLLYSLDTIGRIVELGVLKSKDAKIFAFQAQRILKNPEVTKYLNWLDGEREKYGGERPPHRAAQLLAKLAES